MEDCPDTPTNVPEIPSKDSMTWPDSWKDTESWILRATNAQNQFYIANAGRKFNNASNYEVIEAKILTDAFGNVPPRHRSLAAKINFWYGKIQRKIAGSIRKKMQKLAKSEEVYLNVVYIMGYINETAETAFPVFYFNDANNQIQYIDLQSRVYKNWKDYLENNIMDPSLCCYPKEGHYGQTQTTDIPEFDENIHLSLAVYESPACTVGQTAIRWAKTGLSYAGTALIAATMVASVGGAKWVAKFAKLKSFSTKMQAAKLYINKAQKFYSYVNAASTIAFSLMAMSDKWDHDESIVAEISLIVSTVVSMMSDYINQKIVKAGLGEKDLAKASFEDLSPMTRFFLNIFSLSRCATSMISVMTVLATMLYKENCSASDYFNLSSSIFTCYGTLTSPLGAKAIFDQIQMAYRMEQLKIEIPKAENSVIEDAGKIVSGGAAAAVIAASIVDQFNNDSKVPEAFENTTPYKSNEKMEYKEQYDKKNLNDSEGKCATGYVLNEKQTPEKLASRNPKILLAAAAMGFGNLKTPPIIFPRPQPPPSPLPPNDPPNPDESGQTLTEQEDFVITLRDQLATNIIRDGNDVAGAAAFEYYRENFVLAFRGTENEQVMNQQLIRMMVFADDIRALFCELALTETTLDIRRGILLVNGQLNIDGAAFAETTNHVSTDIDARLIDKIKADQNGKKYNRNGGYIIFSPDQSDREQLMWETKEYNEIEMKLQKEHEAKRNSDEYKKASDKKKQYMENQMSKEVDEEQKTFLKNVAIFTTNKKCGIYRLTFEVQIEELQTLIRKNMGTNVEDLEINGIRPFENLSVSGYHRLRQQLPKNPRQEIIQAALRLAGKLKLTDVEGVLACHTIICTEERGARAQNRTQNFDDSQLDRIAKNVNILLDEAEEALKEKSRDGVVRRYDLRLEDLDRRTVAALAVSHAIDKKRAENKSLENQKKVVKDSVRSEDENRKDAKLVHSQDGKRKEPRYKRITKDHDEL